MSSPRALHRITSIPLPLVFSSRRRAENRSREENTSSSSIPKPIWSSSAFFSSVPTVAKISAPSMREICSAARPTAPVADWIRTLSPFSRRPRSMSPYMAVQNAMGSVAVPSSVSLPSNRWQKAAFSRTKLPNLENDWQ